MNRIKTFERIYIDNNERAIHVHEILEMRLKVMRFTMKLNSNILFGHFKRI